jgi:YidC/Oxa1 family membrane protein insertase
MSLFDTLIVQPIFNLLALIYGLLPGSDFGISLILFTVIVRLLMWPLVKKQLHQTKLMRALQPELKKIKAKTKGDKQLEAKLMMELYRERGVKPFSSFGLLFLQLPIFIALYSVIQIITLHRDKIASFTYEPIEKLQPIADIIGSSTHQFDESLLNIVNLTKVGFSNSAIYWPVIIIAAIAAVLQYVQSKQIMPQSDSKKKLRDIFKDSAAGKDVDQSEVSTIMSNRMIILFPFLTFAVGLYLPGALVLYFATSSAVAVIQQYMLLHRDVEEMEVIADLNTKTTKAKSNATKKRAANATEATITSTPKRTKKSKKKKGRR